MKKIEKGVYRFWSEWRWNPDGFRMEESDAFYNDYAGWKSKILKDRDGVLYSIIIEEIDCNQERIRLLSLTTYDIDEKPMHSSDYSNAGWSYIIPGSVGETIMQKICNSK